MRSWCCSPAHAAGAALRDELLAWCRERLAGYKCPRSIASCATLPLSAAGKVLKTRCARRSARMKPMPPAQTRRNAFAGVPFMRPARRAARVLRRRPRPRSCSTARPELENVIGAVHGGVLATLLDVAMASAAVSMFDFDMTAVTLDLNSSFLDPGRGRLTADGEVLAPRRRRRLVPRHGHRRRRARRRAGARARSATCRLPKEPHSPPRRRHHAHHRIHAPPRALGAPARHRRRGRGRPRAARADPFPSKPITLVLPFPPGGSFDPIFRALGNAASQDLGQPIVLMHKPGGGGVTGTACLATMNEADGYTIAVMHNSVIRPPLVKKMTWDPLQGLHLPDRAGRPDHRHRRRRRREVADAARAAGRREEAARRASAGATSARSASTASTPSGSPSMAGTRFNMIPFKGGSEAFQALIGHHLDVYGDPGFGPRSTAARCACWPPSPRSA